MQPGAAPLIRSAVQRQTPVIEAPVGNQWLLGSLPDGDPVAEALRCGKPAVTRLNRRIRCPGIGTSEWHRLFKSHRLRYLLWRPRGAGPRITG